MEKQVRVTEICPTKTQALIKNGALLVDVREKDEVAQLAYDVPNIINIPLSVFEEHYTEIPKDREVVMVCKSGGRSLRVAGFMVYHGYDNVINMKHGLIRWAQKGFPTIGDTSSVLENTTASTCCDSHSSDSKKSCCHDEPKTEGSCC
ncbi:rhodanese-like domain-containing protein [Flavobacterium sp.]|uniref:rhodanese-like domain-containing protein n=1 Tax=Flavobacterium sp. TaxID=239 RepID=UPI0025BCA908|nr:rhodanese-like domain-containing protein [Flavobacterium sp.]MBA4275877.1 rhodanese-like domain-containing protein [Flavobacterium sp.]